MLQFETNSRYNLAVLYPLWLFVSLLFICGFPCFAVAQSVPAPSYLKYQTSQTYTINKSLTATSLVIDHIITTAALKPSIITFPTIQPNNNGSNIINPGATSTNNETPITYTSSNTAVAIITASGMIQLVGPGVTIITANQAGDSNYSAAQPVIETLTVTQSQDIFFPAITTKTTCDADFSAQAVSSNSTIPLTYSSSNPAVAIISAQGMIHITGSGTTVITVTQSGNTLYDPAPPKTQTLTVIPPSNPVVTINPDHTSICPGTSVTFSLSIANSSNTANFTYQWTLNGVNVSTANTYTNANLTSTDVIKCTVTSNTPCVNNATASFTGIAVLPFVTPSVNITSSATTPVCTGTPITFTATALNGGNNPTYQWQVNGTNAGANSPVFTSSSLTNNDQVTCVISNNDTPCIISQTEQSNTLTANIIPPANPAPAVTISTSATVAYPGVPITFTATPANAGTGVTYQWQVNGTNAGTNSPTLTSSTLTNGDKVTCVLLLSQGCIPSVASNQLVVNIIPAPNVTVPNTFTPNGDGINDFWAIPDLVSYPGCLVTIFTRYGEQIYQSKGYPKPWDGNYKGSQLPMAVYYYLIDLGNNTPKLSGWVTIVR